MKRRGTVDSVAAAVGDVAGALRRRREDREPRVRLYDEIGNVRAVLAESEQGAVLLAAASAMVDAADVGPEPGRSDEADPGLGAAPS